MVLRILAKGYLKIKREFAIGILPLYNKFMFLGLGAKIKGNCFISGKCLLSVGKNSKLMIGDSFRLVGTSFGNPLCRNCSRIALSENAVLEIGNHVGMSSPTIWVRKSIRIGNHVNLGGGVILLDSDAHSLNHLNRRDGDSDMAYRADSPIVIEDDVLIGANVIVLKGVTIGARSVIGAGSVVTKDIPADCVAAGNPARMIKQLR